MLDVICKILNDKYKDNSSCLEENSKECKMKISISNRRHHKYALYRFEPTQYRLDHFARIEGLSKMCDYFLFIQNKDCLYVFIIELKRSSGVSALKQLLAGECFVNYIINSAIRIGENIDISKCYIRRVKIISETKQRVKNCITFNNGYCSNYNLKKFDIDYMIKQAI